MAVVFRNLDATPTDDVTTWPYEGIVITLERGLVPDWQPLLADIRTSPWGPVSRKIEAYLTYQPVSGVTRLFEMAIARAREAANGRDRDLVAQRVRAAVARSGMSAASFAASIGTSPSRLSTYVSGKVTPSAALLVRIERVAGGSGTPGV